MAKQSQLERSFQFEVSSVNSLDFKPDTPQQTPCGYTGGFQTRPYERDRPCETKPICRLVACTTAWVERGRSCYFAKQSQLGPLLASNRVGAVRNKANSRVRWLAVQGQPCETKPIPIGGQGQSLSSRKRGMTSPRNIVRNKANL